MNTNFDPAHASMEQLLEIRDGMDNEMSTHVKSCDHCLGEIALLDRLGDQIFHCADMEPNPELWTRIAKTAELNLEGVDQTKLALAAMANSANQKASLHTSLSRAIYTLAASVLVTGFIGLYMFSNNAGTPSQDALLYSNIQQLMINSRNMEETLEKVSLQSELLTASQRTQADRLYWQLAYLDQMIHENNVQDDNNPERVQVLWNNRIKALTELNQLYYQRKQALEESEI